MGHTFTFNESAVVSLKQANSLSLEKNVYSIQCGYQNMIFKILTVSIEEMNE